jgi:hypothetical protein
MLKPPPDCLTFESCACQTAGTLGDPRFPFWHAANEHNISRPMVTERPTRQGRSDTLHFATNSFPNPVPKFPKDIPAARFQSPLNLRNLGSTNQRLSAYFCIPTVPHQFFQFFRYSSGSELKMLVAGAGWSAGKSSSAASHCSA